MNLLIITGIFPPDIGGPARSVPSIAQALCARGHRVSVVTLSESTADQHDRFSFEVIRITRRLPRLWRFFITVLTILRRGRSADLLFVHGLALEAVAANLWLRKPLVQKVVGDLAWERARTLGLTDERLELFQTGRSTLHLEALKLLRSIGVRKSDLVIAPSRYLKHLIRGWGVDNQKIKVIYNALPNLTAAHPEPPDTAARNLQAGPAITSVGRLVPWKGFAELIGAVEHIPDARLSIIGEGPLRPQLENLIKVRQLQARVHLTGRLPQDKVRECLQQADIFVLNSSYEGLPHIVLEAMAAGVPVVATRAGGTAELVQDGYNGLLIPASDPEALRSALLKLIGDAQLRAQLARNGYETLARFDWDRLVSQTEQALLDAASGGSAAASSGSLLAADRIPVLFISSARYADRGDPTQQKKWKGLEPFFTSTVVCFGEALSPQRSACEGAQLIMLPARLPRLLRYGAHFLTAFLCTLAGALRRKYRAVIAQSPYEGLAPALALLPWKLCGRASRPRLIIELHSDWKEGVMLYHRSWFSGVEKPLRRLIGTFSLSQADAFRVISRYCAGLLPGAQKPVFTFPTFTDLESFHEPPAALVEEVAARHGRGFFLYAGMLIYLKGVHHLIRAFDGVRKKHPRARLIIAGRGEEEEKLKNLVRTLGLSDQVRFIGHVDQQTLSAFIRNAAGLVMPSLTEGLGRVALEAHMLERPVIASRVGGIPEIVADGQTGFLCAPADEDALCRALVRLLEDPGLAERMGKAGKEAVIRTFDYADYFDAYVTMVRDTCGPGACPKRCTDKA